MQNIKVTKFSSIHQYAFLCNIYRNISNMITRTINMDSKENQTFVKLSDKWYKDEMKALQTLNNLRIPWILESTLKHDKMLLQETFPLKGLHILDIGCGGGILSEPLARLGATVTGIDTVKENIDFAQNRLEHKLSKNDRDKIGDKIEFLHTDIESLVTAGQSNTFDVVVASEVLEHVQAWPAMIQHISLLLKNDGIFFATTINRTFLSSVLAIHLAERFLVPPGTHDWNKFIEPEELSHCLKKNNLHVSMIQGMTLNPLTLDWRWINSTLVNYALEAFKVPSQTSSDERK